MAENGVKFGSKDDSGEDCSEPCVCVFGLIYSIFVSSVMKGKEQQLVQGCRRELTKPLSTLSVAKKEVMSALTLFPRWNRIWELFFCFLFFDEK